MYGPYGVAENPDHVHQAYVVRPPVSSDDRLAAALAHGGTFVAWTLAPLFIYLIKRGESKHVELQAMQALLWSLAGTLVSILTCGLAIPIFMSFHAYATYKALKGEDYEYPFVGEIARGLVN